jgi:BclB C-terminal domain-containing protein
MITGLPGQAIVSSLSGDSPANLTPLGGGFDLTIASVAGSVMPRNGTITAISGAFHNTNAIALVGSTITVTVQLYQETTPGSNAYFAIPGAETTLTPPYTGILAIGSFTSGITTGLSIPVVAGTRLIAVTSATVTAGIDISQTINGLTSVGVTID